MARYLNGSFELDGAILNGGQSGTIAVTSQIPSMNGYATKSWCNQEFVSLADVASSNAISNNAWTPVGIGGWMVAPDQGRAWSVTAPPSGRYVYYWSDGWDNFGVLAGGGSFTSNQGVFVYRVS